MQQIRALILLAMVAGSPAMADPLVQAQACFPLTSGLKRLECYDEALSRPPETADLGNRLPPSPSPPPEEGRAALRDAEYFLQGSRKLGRLGIQLIDRASGETLPDAALDRLVSGDAAVLEGLQVSADLVLALPAMPTIGEAAVLTVACRNRITELHVYWPGAFEGRRVEARLLAGAEALPMTMRVTAAGHVLEAPRGLEAIREIRRFVVAERLQISAGDPPRSAFFEMGDLRKALGLQARICSWSGF